MNSGRWCEVLWGCAVLLLAASPRASAQVTRGQPADSFAKRFVGPGGHDVPTAGEVAIPILCERLSFPLHSLSRSLRSSACALTVRARAAVAKGAAADLGVTAADTAQITVAFVSKFVISDEERRVISRYNSVGFGLINREFSLSVHVFPDSTMRFFLSHPLQVPTRQP